MGQITLDQSHSVMATLALNTDWNSIDFATCGLQESIITNPKEAGKQFTAFLKNRAKLLVNPGVITIDRSVPFDSAFVGEGWKVLDDETDTRSIALTELDLSKVRFETMLQDGETSIKGEEKLKRLKKKGHIRLDAKIFQALWENKHLIPESWKEKINGNIRFIYFDGTVLQDSNGDRYVLYLDWDDGKWSWNVYWLDSRWFVYGPSAVLGK